MTLTRINANSITDGSIIDADINASAAIAGTKISPDFGSQTIQTTGVFSHAAGAVGTPSITFTGDLNTGIYSPAADTIAFVEGGVEAMRIDSSSRVGIGTTSPGSRLEVGGEAAPRVGINSTGLGTPGLLFQGAGTTYGSIIENTQSGELAIKAGASGQNSYFITFGTNDGSEKARLDASGRLLVGTSTARVRFFGANNQSAQFQLEGNDSFTAAGAITRNSNDADAPSLILSKARSTTYTAVQYVNGSTSDDKIGRISFQGADGTNLIAAASIECFVDAAPGTNDMPGRLVFSTTNDGASSPTERMRIRSDGNIGFFNTPGIYPNTDNGASVGFSGNRWSAVYAVNGTIQTSDVREKIEVASSVLGSNFIKALRPVSYKWIEGGKQDSGGRDEDGNYIYESIPGQRTHWGFIAQEVKEAVDAAGVDFGGWVLTDKDDPDSQQALRYDQFIAPLTKALQEALAEIDVLKAKVAALEGA
jgi:hypothetical protein